MIELVIVSFFAGVLTVFAPCILPLLPILLGASALDSPEKKPKASLKRPLIIIISLLVSIIIFTLLLKATTALLGIPAAVWSTISGVIVTVLGLTILFPGIWERFVLFSGFQIGSNRLLSGAQSKNGVAKDILLGAALGPVFNSCSPTYALIVAAILPTSFALGMVYLLFYVVGLGAILLLVALSGRAFVQKFKWLSNPNGAFRKIIGVLFVIVGLAIIFSLDKSIQAYVLEQGWYDPIINLEKKFF